MRRQIGRIWLAVALAGGCAVGCQDAGGQTYPADPLFAGRRPIEARAENAPPTALAYNEPAPPPVPPLVLAAARRDRLAGPTHAPAVPASSPGAE